MPLWSWPITPAGSRLLLSDKIAKKGDACCLDQFAASASLTALDCRYGDEYFVANPETLRLSCDAQRARRIENTHANMGNGERGGLRLQALEVIHVHRRGNEGIPRPTSKPRWRRLLVGWRRYPSLYLITDVAGWFLLVACFVAAIVLRLYLAAAFLVAMPATGAVVFALYGSRPRKLLVDGKSDFNRLVVVAEHMNASHWIAVYGESTLVNSLLNRPLEPTGRKAPFPGLLRAILRLLILGQWAIAIGAATTKDWNSFFISFWIMFCITSHAYIITPTSQVRDWFQGIANLELVRAQVDVSSRRALLNTLIALNPDTFHPPQPQRAGQPAEPAALFEQGVRWVDRILKPSPDRTLWEAATIEALNDAAVLTTSGQASESSLPADGSLSAAWLGAHKDNGSDKYWKKYIVEGIYVAAKIRKEMDLPGRKVTR